MDLFDLARQKAERGIDLSRRNSGEDWHDYAYRYLVQYAQRHAEVFPPDLWDAGLGVPVSPRAMGAVMQRAIREGVMTPITYRGMICCQPNPHRRNAMTPVYKSLIFG